MTLEELPGWARELLSTERVARMAFVDDADHPRVLPVTFALAEGAVWTAVDSKPKRGGDREIARVRFLRRRPAAAVCVDRYDDDWTRLAWVQLLGRVAVLAPEHAGAGVQALTDRYPQYREQPPPGPVLRLGLDRVLSWRASE